MTAPTCFISYSWDSDAHRDWVRKLADALCSNGVDTRLDQYDVYPGMDLTAYMETCVRESNFVLLICTPTFAQKANVGKGGVGYEKAIVTGEIFQGSASPKKFVPILCYGDARDSLPAYLASRAFLDFRDDAKFQASMEQLLRHMYESPLYTRPPLGPPPTFTRPAATPPPPSIVVPPAPTAKTLPPTIKGKDGRERILIPAGEFLMGSDEYYNEKPLHKVHLDAFYIDRYPVTNADYKRFVDATKHPVPYGDADEAKPYSWDKDRRAHPKDKANNPVVLVSWDDAVAYAEWAGGRLPTEAEWEKAASWDDGRKEKRRYPWGNEFDKSKCNTSTSGVHDTTPIGKYPEGESPYHVLDMAGNVWEWCADWYRKGYYNLATRNPTGPASETSRVLRGGSWDNDLDGARCTYRFRLFQFLRLSTIGFRVAESVP